MFLQYNYFIDIILKIKDKIERYQTASPCERFFIWTMLHMANESFCTLEEAEVYEYPKAKDFFGKNPKN